ncbi:MAG: hypothetical protein HRU25_09930 [Psychrobium sp.]|nr:hypothetical protein [Psychrobium sp.]
MTLEYIFWGALIIHVALACFNTVSVRESFWLSGRKKIALLLLNWFIPIFGAAFVYDFFRSSFDGIKNDKGGVSSSAAYYPPTDGGGDSCGGSGD